MKKLETPKQFNNKWSNRLERGFDKKGMMINNEEIINLVDRHFTKFEKLYPDFSFSQIKIKFGSARVYIENVNVRDINKLEERINEILDKEV